MERKARPESRPVNTPTTGVGFALRQAFPAHPISSLNADVAGFLLRLDGIKGAHHPWRDELPD